MQLFSTRATETCRARNVPRQGIRPRNTPLETQLSARFAYKGLEETAYLYRPAYDLLSRTTKSGTRRKVPPLKTKIEGFTSNIEVTQRNLMRVVSIELINFTSVTSFRYLDLPQHWNGSEDECHLLKNKETLKRNCRKFNLAKSRNGDVGGLGISRMKERLGKRTGKETKGKDYYFCSRK